MVGDRKQLCLQSTFAGKDVLAGWAPAITSQSSRPARLPTAVLPDCWDSRNQSLANPLMSLPGTWRTGSSGFPSWRQRLLPVLNSASQAISSLLNPGLSGYGIILRYKKSYFYFITIIIIAAKEDESRVLSMPWENLDLRLDL